MLVISRKENESIRIEPVDGLDSSLTLREVFAQGPILLKLTNVGQRRVRIVVEAPSALRITRSEAPAISCVDVEPSGESAHAADVGRRIRKGA